MKDINKALAALTRKARGTPRLFGQMTVWARTLQISAGHYTAPLAAYAPLALELVDVTESPEPWYTLTVVVRGISTLAGDEIAVKTYDLDASMRAQILASGYFEDTERRLPAGYAQVEIWRLTPAFAEAARTAYPKLQPAGEVCNA